MSEIGPEFVRKSLGIEYYCPLCEPFPDQLHKVAAYCENCIRKLAINQFVSPQEISLREQTLREAIEAVTKDRNTDYGSPEDNFKDIADMYDIYRRGLKRINTLPHDIAIIGILIKICRIKTSPQKKDNWVDIEGYGACGYEAVVKGGI